MSDIGTLPPGTFMDFSPIRKCGAEKENEFPVLSLVLFSKAPFVSFGTVKVGTSKSAVLHIENPAEDAEAEVTVDKIPSSKGFSVNQTAFTIQPQGVFSLTITWTPTEEGGIRELIIFIGNRVLKHQAVLLGRAEASKKKKKSLWDAIKNKRGAEKGSPYKGKRTEPPTKMAANKTVQVSRKPQHKRDKLRSPLSSLNEGKPVREKLFHKHSHPDDNPQESEQKKALNPIYKPWSLADQENVRHVQKHSSPVLATQVTGSLVEKLESKVLAKMLNTTLSPIGTPERFKEIMPRIKSVESHVIGGPALSLTDALALIDSDLSPVSSSPRDTSSNCVFSDSLESKSDNHECGMNENVFNAQVGSPEMSQSTKHGLTFSKKAVMPEAVEIPTKLAFNCETVIKKKAPVSERKIKKSKRRLMEKTLELTESCSHSESGPGTPSLPVIEPDWTQRSAEVGFSCVNTRAVQELDTSSTTQKADASPSPIALLAGTQKPTIHLDFTTNSPPLNAPLMTFTVTSPSSLSESSFRHCSNKPNNRLPESSPTDIASADPSARLDSFPIHTARKSRKRKSEEYLKSALKIDAGGKTEPVKRTRTVVWKNEPTKSTHERTWLQKQQAKSTGSVHSMTTSLKTAKSSVPAQTKTQSTKLASQGAGFLRSSRESRVKGVKPARVAALAQSKLTFIKPAQTVIPRHPLPFAAKNMFYDERWIEKQERGFTWWLNYVLTPDDFKVNTEMTKVSAASLAMGCSDEFHVAKAPTKEEMSFSTYTARRKLNRLRRSACQLFTSETLVKAIKKLEIEVEAKRLLIRKDRHLWKDIGERQKVLNWLLSYNPLWLRIGLETIFGELISLENNSDAMGLAMFILQRLLWNPDIAAEFRHPKVPHLYKDGHEEALSCFTLKKLLLLVCFLDKAKESRLMEHDPCLFCMDAEFKKSKDLLLAFSRDFLSGEGILPRHLGYLGLPVSHVQTPLDEFNFAVGNLAVDLKCGIRLVRVMELLIKQWGLSAKLRLPAISRLQKVHNVDITFQVLKSRGVDLKDELGQIIDSRDIVDGHREKTLSLLWKIIFSFQVEVILDDDLMREEIGFLRRTLWTKQRLASLKADRGPDSSAPKTQVPYEHSSTKVALLMEWARSVCDFYNLKVENFTVTFSDGRVLCYLIHHYQPGLIPEKSVHHITTQTVECSSRGRLELDCSATDSDNSFDNSSTGQNGPQSPSVEFKELLENEKSNFRLVNNAVAFLGGVPAMINPADMSNTIPNEKVVMSYLSFLCARLLDLRNETRAARIIQGAWRKYRLKKDLQLYKVRNVAAGKIQVALRHFLARRWAEKQCAASLIIQSAWRGYVTRKSLRTEKDAALWIKHHQAATIIQAQWRMFSAMKSYHQLRYYTIVLQARWRMRKAATAFGRIYWATVVVQRHLRAWILARKQRGQYLLLQSAAVKIQRGYRQWKILKTQKENHAAKVVQTIFRKWYAEKMPNRASAAVKIQSWYRMRRCLYQYKKFQRSSLLIQAYYRAHVQRRNFHKLKQQHNSAIVIQSVFRGYAVRKRVNRNRTAFLQKRVACVILQAGFRGMKIRTELKKKHKAATVIQSAVRMFLCRKRYILLQSAAIVIQCRYKALLQCRAQQHVYREQKKAAITIQAGYRAWREKEEINKRHHAARVIQAKFKMYEVRMAYLATKCAAVIIQERFRAKILMNQQLKMYRDMKSAAVIIQAAYRGHQARMEVMKMHCAAMVIQRMFLTFQERNKFLAIRTAVLVFQQRYRAVTLMKKARTDYLSKRMAAICLQSAFRGYTVRKQLIIKHKAAVTIQSNFRKCQQKHFYRRLQWAVSVLQGRYRANKKMRHERLTFRAKRHAAIILQSAFRGMKSRRIVKQKHQAAATIQRVFRAHYEHKKYLALKSSVLAMQRRYRATLTAKSQMRLYQNIRKSAVIIQAAYRGMRARKNVVLWHQAATVIQSVFRRHKAEVKFQAMRLSAIIIQKYYRAYVRHKQERELFVKVRSSAIVLQAAFRGYSARREIAKMQRAATVLQATFRKHKQQSTFRKQCWAACVLQQRFRALKQRNVEVRKYNEIRKSVVCLQAAFRGMKSRQSVKQMHQAATTIQKAFRACCEHKKYLALKTSVLAIQCRYRATVAAKSQMQHYQNMKEAVVLIQAAYRGMRVRNCVARWHQAAIVIQSAFRRHREEIKFQAMRLSAVIVQRYFRAYILQKQDRRRYFKVRSSAIVLQAAFRGYSVRRRIALMHKAATVLQANFKRHRQQMTLRKQRWAVSVLQQRFRALKQKNVEVKHYQEVKKAVISLQAAFRGMKLRQSIRQMHQAATTIQKAFRAHCEYKKYLALKTSVLCIQRRYRATVAAKAQMQNYQNKKKAVVIIQAVYRGMRVRNCVAQWHQAAIVIQSAFRRHREEIKFQAMRLSAVIVQRYFRAYILQKQDRRHYFKVRSSAIVLQAAFRGYSVRRRIALMHRAATILQANFKRHKQQVTFRKQRWAASVLQQRFRALKQKNVEVKHYQEVKKAVISLQAAFRGMKLRQYIRQMHQAATTVQKAFRAHCEHKKYLALKTSVLAIQRRYRATVAAKAQMQNYQNKKKAVVIIQAAYRGMRVRNCVARWHQAAIVIQSAFRRHREEIKFQAMRLSAVIVQRYFRAYILQKQDRRHYFKVRSSAIVLQAAFRGYSVRRRIALMHRAATILQANFKGHKQQITFRKQRCAVNVLQRRFRALKQKNIEVKHYQEVKKAVISLQAAFRGMKSRQSIKLMDQAATTIQTAFRAHREKEKYLKIKSSVLTIQRQFQATVAAKTQRKRFLDARRSAIVFQATYRGQQARKHLAHLHLAATIIQTAYRKHVAVVKFQEMRASAVFIQRFYRAFNDQRQERNNFLKILQATIIIQAAFKGYCVRKHINRQSQAACVIQSYWRCIIQRRVFLKKREAAVKLQQKIRAMQLGKLDRNKYVRIRQAAITLQTQYRAWTARKLKLEAANVQRRLCFAGAVYHHLSAIKIQRALRAHWVLESAKRQIHIVIAIQRLVRVKQQKRRYMENRRKVVTAQRAVRRWLTRRHKAASVIQDATRRFLLLRRQKRRERGIVKAQALWRGHCSRRLNDNAKIIKLRQNLRKVSTSAREEDKLFNKTFSALDCILRYKHFSHILKALENLETTTRLSPVCCEQLVDRGATSVIFTLIRSCNRSVSCMDVITFSIQILLNLAKHHKTTEAVYLVDNSVDTLVDLLLRYRGKAGDKVPDKGGIIFTKASFLLLLLLQDKKHVGEVMNNPKMLDRLRSIYRLTVHKHKMDAERNVTKQKMNASINGSFYVQQTPPRKSRPVPKFAPDWVLRKDTIKDIVDPLMAIQMVANTLFISL
ncbi:abnormal spindle-like microcephaly-associated protein [Entelurus aequoreus]|uniref:abnormal spindle-like microcephaly-associated protein n=1 Tax=Entelurus aequoreus TaxID=161455 RepID=UPI002B1E3D88|nr:abnormal spindle-like microcephaly-associated protein [Entelurus aequoreus]